MATYSDNNFKQKAVIEFLLKQGIAAREISDRLRNVYGEWAISYTTVRRWVAEFKGGRSDIIDKPRSGRPSSAVTEANKPPSWICSYHHQRYTQKLARGGFHSR